MTLDRPFPSSVDQAVTIVEQFTDRAEEQLFSHDELRTSLADALGMAAQYGLHAQLTVETDGRPLFRAGRAPQGYSEKTSKPVGIDFTVQTAVSPHRLAPRIQDAWYAWQWQSGALRGGATTSWLPMMSSRR